MKTPPTHYTDATGKQWQTNTPYPKPRPEFPEITDPKMFQYWNARSKEWMTPPTDVQSKLAHTLCTHWIIVPPLPEPQTQEDVDTAAAEEWMKQRHMAKDYDTRHWLAVDIIASYRAGLASARKKSLDRVNERMAAAGFGPLKPAYPSCPKCARALSPIRIHGLDTFYCSYCIPYDLRGIETALVMAADIEKQANLH